MAIVWVNPRYSIRPLLRFIPPTQVKINAKGSKNNFTRNFNIASTISLYTLHSGGSRGAMAHIAPRLDLPLLPIKFHFFKVKFVYLKQILFDAQTLKAMLTILKPEIRGQSERVTADWLSDSDSICSTNNGLLAELKKM
ncbi:hypothetical protein HELRODRAFT_166195 [Helobdella robusta]|uniref:Uncharacterized protein n=1 Tax=Helobdella robusta TaxID=6412 RepID=T1EXW0_HELRO|nr:hypothetical protein HELRODRAFT_166195 [Helobdella robusta]ESN90521.1 hypothetical protein HELRODRAFT_166195 [Helobdella robusta]